MKPEVLMIIAKTNPVQLEPAAEAEYTVHKLAQTDMADCGSHVAEYKDRVRALITQTAPGADAALIGALPNIEIIACSGAHVDAIDLAAARARGIPVINTPGISYDDVGDYVMAQMLATSRRLIESHRFVRDGRWPDGGMGFGRRVGGKKVGIFGLGGIGRIVARRVLAFDMEVCYSGPRRKDDVPYAFFDDLVEMARHVDYLVICCPESPQTRHLVNMPVLRALGPEGVLINVARGPIVDEAALVEALERGVIAGAGLDVFENEPHVPEALIAMDNVILQAHVGAFTTDGKLEMVDIAMTNLLNHFAGQPLLTPVG